MFNLFTKYRENARKAAEYDDVVAERRILGRALSEARAEIDVLKIENRIFAAKAHKFDKLTSNLIPGGKPRKAAAEQKVDA